MAIGRTSFNVNKHMQENFWLYLVSLICVFTGVVLGIYAVKYMNGIENNSLLSYLNSFNKNISGGSFKYSVIIADIIKNNLTIVIAIWFLGLTMIGIPVILIIDIIKGFTLGFTISFIIKNLGINGISLVLLGVIPQNIIYIPCILVCSVVSMGFSLDILKDKIRNKGINSIWIKIASYSFSFLLIFAVMFLGILLEAYATPNLIRLII